MVEIDSRIGLYTEDGILKKDGKPYSTIGVNYLGLFYDALSHDFDISVGLKGMETLASYGVRLLRVPVNATYDTEIFSNYFYRRKQWFDILDKIVAKAEELQLGLLCSFFWSERVIPSYYGEDVGESFRSCDSKSAAYMDTYVKEFIERYGESRAIWGWEYGNEIMLEAQLPICAWKNGQRLFGCDDIVAVYKRFVATVKKYDKHNRFIGSGDAGLRPCAYHAYKEDSWQRDTRNQQLEMMRYLYPMEGVSGHEYSNPVKRLNAPNIMPETAICRFDENENENGIVYKTWSEFFRYLTDTAKTLGKIAYLGETGFTYDDADRRLDYSECKAMVDAISEAAFREGFPLTIFWNYDPYTDELESKTDMSGTGWAASWNERWPIGKATLDSVKKYNVLIEQNL